MNATWVAADSIRLTRPTTGRISLLGSIGVPRGSGLPPLLCAKSKTGRFRKRTLSRLEIVVALGNLASRRVAEKVGAVLEGTLQRRLLLHGAARDATMFLHARYPNQSESSRRGRITVVDQSRPCTRPARDSRAGVTASRPCSTSVGGFRRRVVCSHAYAIASRSPSVHGRAENSRPKGRPLV
jgi:hypothetical protein